MILIDGKEVFNKASEMTLKQYEDVNVILNNKHTDSTEKYIKVFKYFGVDEEYLDNLDFKEFAEFVRQFSQSEKVEIEKIKEFELNGYTYKSFDEDFKISVKDLKEIEKAFSNERHICQLMAIFFKRTDLSNKEHYTPAHIKEKAKLFRLLNAEFCVPYLFELGKMFAKQLEDAKTEIVE
jgi:hypothetical protein